MLCLLGADAATWEIMQQLIDVSTFSARRKTIFLNGVDPTLGKYTRTVPMASIEKRPKRLPASSFVYRRFAVAPIIRWAEYSTRLVPSIASMVLHIVSSILGIQRLQHQSHSFLASPPSRRPKPCKSLHSLPCGQRHEPVWPCIESSAEHIIHFPDSCKVEPFLSNTGRKNQVSPTYCVHLQCFLGIRSDEPLSRSDDPLLGFFSRVPFTKMLVTRSL